MSTTEKKKEFEFLPHCSNRSGVEAKSIQTHVKKKWGHEIWFANNNLYCGKELYVQKNSKSSDGKMHYHKIKDETFYILEGRLILDILMEYGDVASYTLTPGDSFRIEPNTPHRFSTTCFTSCTFIEASTFHDDKDSYYTDDNPEHLDYKRDSVEI